MHRPRRFASPFGTHAVFLGYEEGLRAEPTGSSVITHGEQRNYHNVWTYCVQGLAPADDYGFPPFSDDTSTRRDTAFAKIQARVLGTALAARLIEGR